MDIISKAAFFLDPTEAVKKAINKWSPNECKTEKDFENSLYNFLHEHFDDVQITKQDGVGRSRADLNVGDKVLIEVKKDLRLKSQHDRLTGQLEDYRKWKGSIIILLVGETEPNLKKKLLRYQEEHTDGWSGVPFHLVEKKVVLGV